MRRHPRSWQRGHTQFFCARSSHGRKGGTRRRSSIRHSEKQCPELLIENRRILSLPTTFRRNDCCSDDKSHHSAAAAAAALQGNERLDEFVNNCVAKRQIRGSSLVFRCVFRIAAAITSDALIDIEPGHNSNQARLAEDPKGQYGQ